MRPMSPAAASTSSVLLSFITRLVSPVPSASTSGCRGTRAIVRSRQCLNELQLAGGGAGELLAPLDLDAGFRDAQLAQAVLDRPLQSHLGFGAGDDQHAEAGRPGLDHLELDDVLVAGDHAELDRVDGDAAEREHVVAASRDRPDA